MAVNQKNNKARRLFLITLALMSGTGLWAFNIISFEKLLVAIVAATILYILWDSLRTPRKEAQVQSERSGTDPYEEFVDRYEVFLGRVADALSNMDPEESILVHPPYGNPDLGFMALALSALSPVKVEPEGDKLRITVGWTKFQDSEGG